MNRPSYDIVIPTIGRPSLRVLLDTLASGRGPRPRRVIVVDDRRDHSTPLLPDGYEGVAVLRGRGAGPASARNVGWRAATADWVAFLDDDVIPDDDWAERLAEDLRGLGDDVGGSQGNVRVPLPADRPPTDWERNVACLETATWITADLVYRRSVLEHVGGFDERFRRAYREDADLSLRVMRAGYRFVRGARGVTHPVRPAGRWVSVRQQAGNADDALMRKLHGGRWRTEPRGAGRRPRHLLTVASALVAVAGLTFARPALALVGSVAWLAGTLELAWARIAPGPRTRDEVTTMLLTSAAIPFAATGYWVAGLARRERPSRTTASPPTRAVPQPRVSRRSPVQRDGSRRPEAPYRNGRPHAVLFDRDGTLVEDVPYNGDPARVVPMPGAREALALLRREGIPLGVVSNQSGVARGLLTRQQVDAVNRRIEEELGPLGVWMVCVHAPGDGCGCRKPSPRLIADAAAALGVDVEHVAVIGDIGSDVEAARAAGARAILVPTDRTRPEEIAAAPEVARDLREAVEALLGKEVV